MPDKEVKLVASTAFKIAIFMTMSAQNRDQLRALGCATYVPGVGEEAGFSGLTTAERNQLLSGARTVEEIYNNQNHQGDAVFKQRMEDEALACSVKWGLASNPGVAVYYGGSLDFRSVGLGRATGWLGAHHGCTFIRCNWEGPTDDNLILDSCSSDIASMLPPIGTDVTAIGIGGLINMCGFVHVPD